MKSKRLLPVMLLCSSLLQAQDQQFNPVKTKVVTEQHEETASQFEEKHRKSVWFKLMKEKNPNYFQVKKLFTDYFHQHPSEDSKAKDVCANWLKTQVFYLDKKNRVVEPPKTNYNKITAAAPKAWASVTDTMAGDWRMIGPRNIYETNYSGKGNKGGYVSCARIDPTDASKMFIGFTTGGLWVSANGGSVWQLTDANLPDREYIDLDICKANNSYVYAISRGTSAAVIKSTDGGLTWSSTNMNATNYPGVNAYDIAVSPSNPNIVLARWGTAVYRTTDGGTTWTSILTGLKNYSVWGGAGVNAEMLDFHATNSNIVYHIDRNDNQNYVTLYRSGNAGSSFTNLGNISIPSGVSDNIVGWAKLLTATNNPGVVYMAMGTGTSAYGHHAVHLFKLDSLTGAVLQTRANMVSGDPGLHHGDITMDINNDNNIVYGSYAETVAHYSTNNGASFSNSTTTVHADLRTLSMVSGKVLLGNDGEAVYSSNNGNTFTNLTAAISNHELWGFGAAHKSDILGAGTNHGPLMIRENEGYQGWYNAMGADQGNSDVNPLHDIYLYSQGYSSYHVVRTGPRTMNSGAGGQEIDPGGIYAYFNTMHFHPNLYYTLITHHAGGYPTGNPNLATWKKSLIRSDNNGVTINKIIKTFTNDVFREDICMSNPNVIYVVEGLTNNKLWKTTDGGTTWTDITPSTAVTGTGVRNISDIAVSDLDPNEIWVTYSGVQNTCQVLRSANGGSSYSNLTTSVLTSFPVTKILFQRGSAGGVYVGNKSGVFYRNNAMGNWVKLGNGLPMLDVRFMFINYFKGKLMIGTSRGAWEHDLYEHSNPRAQISADRDTISCTTTGSVQFRDYSVVKSGPSVTYSWSFPGGSPSTSTAENPLVSYAGAASGNYNVSLTVTDQYGSHSQTLTNFIKVLPNTCEPCQAIIPRTQYAIHGFSSQETSAESAPASNVIDGNSGTIWHTKYSGGVTALPHYVSVDLGGTYNVTRLNYLPRQNSANGRINAYQVHVSTNGTTWTQVATGNFANSAIAQDVVLSAPATARYVRLTATSEVGGNQFISAAELSFYGCAVPASCSSSTIARSNYSVHAFDSQETSSETSPATNAIDGSTSTIWHTRYSGTTAPMPHYITINLGAVHNLTSMNYTPRQNSANGRIKNYTLEVSVHGTTWFKVAEGVWPNNTAVQTVGFTAIPARYVRLTATSEVNNNPWASVAELSFSGCGTVSGFSARMQPPAAGTITEFSETLSVHPVPTNGPLTVKLPQVTGKGTVLELFNMNGALVKKQQLSGAETSVQLNIASLPAGMYLLVLKDEAGISHKVRVVKQ